MNKIGNYVDVLFVVGILANLIKVSDMILRPYQQNRLQEKLEELTLWLDYTRPLKWFEKHISPTVLHALFLISGGIVIFVSFIVVSFIYLSEKVESIDTAIVLMFLLSCGTVFIAVKWLDPPIIRWLFAGASRLSFAKRFLMLTLVSVGVTGVFAVANPFDSFSYEAFFLVLLITAPIVTFVNVINYLGYILILTVAASTVLEVVLRIIRGVAWRVVEYNKGAFAALVLVVTVALGVAELYLRVRK
jgi:hypothetical protein